MEKWLRIPVPAIVEPKLFMAAQEQLRENQRHARQSRRGALYLLQGLVQCQQCGYACYEKCLSPSARKGKPRAYAYYRCLGTDAYRFGGERVCQNTQVRQEGLAEAPWSRKREMIRTLVTRVDVRMITSEWCSGSGHGRVIPALKKSLQDCRRSPIASLRFSIASWYVSPWE